jgi:hypothetical protein
MRAETETIRMEFSRKHYHITIYNKILVLRNVILTQSAEGDNTRWSQVVDLPTVASTNKNSEALVRKRTIPTERPPLVGEVRAIFR